MRKLKIGLIIIIAFLVILFFGVRVFDKKVSFVAVGDNLIHPVVYNDARSKNGDFDFKPMYKPIASYIKSADIAYINQESPLGGDNKPYHGFKRFNTPSSISNDLLDTGFNMINNGNNHSLDQGTDGLINEIKTWEKINKNILVTGTYKNEHERNKVPILSVKNTDVALLSYTYGTNGIKPENPYNISLLNKATIKKDVIRAKKKSDVILVSVHWGNEGKQKINQKQKEYGKYFADLGVDAVIGTHPHVIQPVKWVQGDNGHKTLIAYSLGNFLNGQETGDEKNILAGSIAFDIDKKDEDEKIKNVKWKSMIVHSEMTNKNNKDTRKNFVIYPLNEYNREMIHKNGFYGNKSYNINKENFESITRKTIDKEFLDKNSY
ncbi:MULTISPECIES: CapA family protein [unclassified Mammaliicoccus]|uniref:CapA family protein n=1 Tax=unclassified Mammaliicoccus TaxID=2803851 RepID=UPI001EFA80BF|nr:MULTISPECIES: CapA family protein [unclassified Mammaliicoccus]